MIPVALNTLLARVTSHGNMVYSISINQSGRDFISPKDFDGVQVIFDQL